MLIKSFKDYQLSIYQLFADPQKDGGYKIGVETFDYNKNDYDIKDVFLYPVGEENPDVYPRIIIKPKISIVPIGKGYLEDGTKYSLHESLIQIDVFSKSKDEIEALDIIDALVERTEEFMCTQIRKYDIPIGWEDYNNIKKNVRYNSQFMEDEKRYILRYGDYTELDTIEEVENTSNSWCLANDGLYINGEDNLKIIEAFNGRVFPNKDTLYSRGFDKFEDVTQLRDLEDDSNKNTYHLEMEYKAIFNIYRPKPDFDRLEEVVIDATKKK